MNRSGRFLLRASLSLYGASILLVLLGVNTVQSATYYVATTGSDSNPGTSDRPWRNPQKCAASPIKAGDTCIVRNGTYTDVSGLGVTVYISGNSAAGTASLPITIKSENLLGAVLIVPSIKNGLNAGVYVSQPYYIIQGFDITGGTKNYTSVAYTGILFRSTATGGIARLNAIHHIGRPVCSNSIYGFTGIVVRQTSNVLIERNRIYSIGRQRNGENGCSTTLYQNDHGIYIQGATNLTLRRNVFYDTNRGFPIQLYNGTVNGLKIYHNTLSGKSPTGKPLGQIMLGSTISGAAIQNNISNDAPHGMIAAYNLSASSVTVSYNQSNTLMRGTTSVPGVSFSNNLENSTNLNFISKSTNDFRLSSTSGAINRGTSIGVPVVPDGRPDNGGYEYSTQSNISSPLTPTGVRVQ